MSSFLTPVKEVFVFIEDTMTIKVGYALAAGELSKLNSLLNISFFGGLISGIFAFLLMVVLCLVDSTAGHLLNPSETSNSNLIAQGCSLIPTTDDLLHSARIFWLLTAAAWIPNFSSKECPHNDKRIKNRM